jgi:hypothetical protein
MEGREEWKERKDGRMEGWKKRKRKRRGERMLLPCNTNFEEFVVATSVALFNDCLLQGLNLSELKYNKAFTHYVLRITFYVSHTRRDENGYL